MCFLFPVILCCFRFNILPSTPIIRECHCADCLLFIYFVKVKRLYTHYKMSNH